MAPKVLIVTALAGFIRSFLDNDINILQSMGYEVHCAANKFHPGAEEIDNYFREKKVIFNQIDFSSDNPVSKRSFVAWKQIKKLVKENDYSLVHCHTPIAGALTRWVCRNNRKNGMKVIYTTHGFFFHKGSSIKSWILYYTIEKLMSNYSDMIITINSEDFSNAQKMHCKQVKYINGVGVDTECYTNVTINRNAYRATIGVNATDLMILAVGELSPRKNHQVIIKALGRLNISNAVFVICGNAMKDSATNDLLTKLSREFHVKTILLGLRKDIPQICHCADIGVMPSTREGLGLAGIEMLASGLPLVTSNVQGILDYMVDGETGYVNDPVDIDGFANSINKLSKAEERNRMHEKCIAAAKRFDKSISNSQMQKIYAEILCKGF